MGIAVRHLQKRLMVDRYTARLLLRAAERRKPRFSIVTVLTLLLLCILFVALIGCLVAPLAMALLGRIGYFASIGLGLCGAVAIAMHMEQHSRASAAIRAIERARLRHECLHCGYDLRPNLADAGTPTCPECGEPAIHLTPAT